MTKRQLRSCGVGVEHPSGGFSIRRLGFARRLLEANGWGWAALLLASAAPAVADTQVAQAPLAYTQLPDPAQEAAAQRLMAELRCLVCQGQSIADSDADMAGAMRALVRERVAQGEQPGAIRAWLIARYGDYVSYDPPLSLASAPLWLAPLLLIGVGVLIARSSFRWRR